MIVLRLLAIWSILCTPYLPLGLVVNDSKGRYLPTSVASLEYSNRRAFLGQVASGLIIATVNTISPSDADALVGPVKIALKPKQYSAVICPPEKPIPGEKAMVGMKGLCVTVRAELLEQPPRDLEKVGVYGFVMDGFTGDSVLANNPDLSTDAGQFAMIETVRKDSIMVEFEFIAAVPRDRDTSQYQNGIGPLDFQKLRLIR
jgi:hypothetical protein